MFVYLWGTGEDGSQPMIVNYDSRSKEKGDSMNFDPGQLGQLLNQIPYPIGKDQLKQLAQQYGANAEITGLIDLLPDKTFNSAQDIQDSLGGLGNFGGFKL
jgi:hypothetical protein